MPKINKTIYSKKIIFIIILT